MKRLFQIVFMNGREPKKDAIIYVVDCNNIRRNLYFCTQLLELNIPTILLFNMYDIILIDNKIDFIKLKNELNVHSIIPFSAYTKMGLSDLNNSLTDIFSNSINCNHNIMNINKDIVKILDLDI